MSDVEINYIEHDPEQCFREHDDAGRHVASFFSRDELREIEGEDWTNVGTIDSLLSTLDAYRDELEAAWGIIANAYGGDWTKAHEEWQQAAANWRQRYHLIIGVKAKTLPADQGERT